MSAIVLVLFCTRIYFVAFKSANAKAEILFFLICTVIGAFNDWNSVGNKEIYQYTVPYNFDFLKIPIWMLLYWGIILRLIAGFSNHAFSIIRNNDSAARGHKFIKFPKKSG